MMPAKPTGIVRWASLKISTEAKRDSVKLMTNAKIATLAATGVDCLHRQQDPGHNVAGGRLLL